MRKSTIVSLALLWGCLPPSVQGALPAAPQAESVAPSQAQLTNDTLKDMLTSMGYEPKPLSKGFLLAIKQDTWTINMQIVLSPDRNKMGLNANLGKVEDPASISADTWLQLLISNGDMDPSAFYFDKDQKKLYLHRSFDNRGITPASLRREIDNFASNVRSTEELWKFTK